jgi:hypothetical protein
MKNLKDKILYCLKNNEKTRNSDIYLTIAIWATFYKQDLLIKDNKIFVDVEKLFNLPREDSVKRIRSVIQNEEHLFLPTEKKIRDKRKIKEEEWRSYLGFNPEMRTI